MKTRYTDLPIKERLFNLLLAFLVSAVTTAAVGLTFYLFHN